jgi:hypothetical protein
MGWGLVLTREGTLDAWGEQDVPNDPGLRRHILGKTRFESIAGRGAAACAIDPARGLVCWAQPGNQVPPVASNVLAVGFSAPQGAMPACAIVARGTASAGDVVCTRTVKGRPLALPGDFVALAVGDAHVCGRTAAGQATCVGEDLYGEVTGGARWP